MRFQTRYLPTLNYCQMGNHISSKEFLTRKHIRNWLGVHTFFGKKGIFNPASSVNSFAWSSLFSCDWSSFSWNVAIPMKWRSCIGCFSHSKFMCVLGNQHKLLAVDVKSSVAAQFWSLKIWTWAGLHYWRHNPFSFHAIHAHQPVICRRLAIDQPGPSKRYGNDPTETNTTFRGCSVI